jgi:histidine triad (HIT) family protein
VAFSDLNPQAPTHLLVVPKRRIALLQDATKDDAALLGHLMLAAAEAARIANLDAGYRVIVNNGYDGLQSVRCSAPHVAARESPSWHSAQTRTPRSHFVHAAHLCRQVGHLHLHGKRPALPSFAHAWQGAVGQDSDSRLTFLAAGPTASVCDSGGRSKVELGAVLRREVGDLFFLFIAPVHHEHSLHPAASGLQLRSTVRDATPLRPTPTPPASPSALSVPS